MGKTLFDHVNAIYQDQSLDYFDSLSESDQKTFNVYMVNRVISMNPSQIELVNELQTIAPEIHPRAVYLFYSNSLPKKRQFHKYIKSVGNDERKPDLEKLIAQKFEISLNEAFSYIQTLLAQDDGKEQLKILCEQQGIDAKTITEWGL